ncbi:hypothetical protein AXF42_Ash002697 [Apostasia shenzhenica]|uniref:Ribonuclease H1 N-terminal domain-containing protein n=1 Tax=Apostasia shenzhenica TaxID=1088818 RepID=A0A2I0A711_9ASPA|nr:hypothetical protein AXF42_Ash002697 [Apostasia shenzhenica]
MSGIHLRITVTKWRIHIGLSGKASLLRLDRTVRQRWTDGPVRPPAQPGQTVRLQHQCDRMMSLYLVLRGRKEGVFQSWAECHALVHKYPGAVYFKVKSMEKAIEKSALYRKLIKEQADYTEIPNLVVNEISNPLHRKQIGGSFVGVVGKAERSDGNIATLAKSMVPNSSSCLMFGSRVNQHSVTCKSTAALAWLPS